MGSELKIKIPWPILHQIKQDFRIYRDTSPYLDPEEEHWSLCRLQTRFGSLQIDLKQLLCDCAILVESREQYDSPIRITKRTVNFAKRVFQRLPQYLERDLLGLMYETLFDENARIGGETTWERQFAQVHDPAAGTVNLFWLKELLKVLGAGSLDIAEIRSLLKELYAKDGLYGKKRWQRLIEINIRPVRPRGRPRNTEYDQIFGKRLATGQKETYGKLIRDLSTYKSIDPEKLRNRAKASVSYRKKRQQAP